MGRGAVAVVLLGTAACGNDSDAPAGGAGATPSPGVPPEGSAGWSRVDLGFVAAYVLVRGREAAAVDTGTPGSADAIGGPRPMAVAADGTEIFGLQVVATPGHTAGHISLFDPAAGVLVAGDALTNTAGLAGSNPQYTADEAQARESVRKLAALPVRTIYVGHGDPVRDGAAEALRRLAGSG